MNHEMPVMTEEKRQALIAFNQAIITQHAAYAVPESGWPDDVLMLVESARVALASLTAEPKEWYVIRSDGSVHTVWESERETKVTASRIAGTYRHGDYTAPPVQVLQPVELPEKQWSDYGYYIFEADDVVKAIRAAGGEVAE